MSKERRIFSPEDRYSLVQEALRDGHSEVCRKYNLSPSLLRRWKLKYLNKGKDGLKDSYQRVDPQMRALEEENERLKRIIAKQALELEVKSELLKKRLSDSGKGNAYVPVSTTGYPLRTVPVAGCTSQRVLLPA